MIPIFTVHAVGEPIGNHVPLVVEHPVKTFSSHTLGYTPATINASKGMTLDKIAYDPKGYTYPTKDQAIKDAISQAKLYHFADGILR